MNESPYIATYNGHPLRFVKNLSRRYEVCHIERVTEFATYEDAEVAIVDHGLKGNPRVSIRRKILPEPVTKN